MIKNRKIFNRFTALLILFAVTLSSCGTFQPQNQQIPPTEDLDRLRTEVAQTVMARITYEAAQTLAAEPTATFETLTPTSEELQGTRTLTPTLPIITYTPTPITPTATPTETVKVVYPTWTPTYYPDRVELASQIPADGTYFAPGEDFDLVFQIKNTGDRTWSTSFYLKFLSGVPGQNQSGQNVTLVYLPRSVAPGDTVGVIIDMVAPLTPGSYTSNWAFVNDDGTTVFSPNLVFFVSD
jgi:hypothetical protein